MNRLVRLTCKEAVQIPSGATEEQIEQAYRGRFTEFCSVANAILHDREQAIDAVQDAFASALAKRSQWRGSGTVDAWLWRGVINAAHDRRRKRKAAFEARSYSDGRSKPPAALEGEASTLTEAVAALPERQRLVVFLRYYGDLDYRRIADVLDIKEGTVAATLHQAQQTLRRALEVCS